MIKQVPVEYKGWYNRLNLYLENAGLVSRSETIMPSYTIHVLFAQKIRCVCVWHFFSWEFGFDEI